MSHANAAPPPITPDTKDWTWVLDEQCPECGFDTAAFDRAAVAPLLRDNARAWQSLLVEAPNVRDRLRPDHWSILEYASHVRDVCRLFHERLNLMLDQVAPHFANWDQDATAIDERYDLADPQIVAGELGQAAEALAARFETVTGDQWERAGFRSDGAAFTVESFACYFIHDPVHHLHDVR